MWYPRQRSQADNGCKRCLHFQPRKASLSPFPFCSSKSAAGTSTTPRSYEQSKMLHHPHDRQSRATFLGGKGIHYPTKTKMDGGPQEGGGSVHLTVGNRFGFDLDQYQTGPNSKFKFEFKKMKKFLKILQGAKNLMVSNFLKISFV